MHLINNYWAIVYFLRCFTCGILWPTTNLREVGSSRRAWDSNVMRVGRKRKASGSGIDVKSTAGSNSVVWALQQDALDEGNTRWHAEAGEVDHELTRELICAHEETYLLRPSISATLRRQALLRDIRDLLPIDPSKLTETYMFP